MAEVQKFDSCNLIFEQIVLRPLVEEDQEAIFAACNDAEMQRWFPLPNSYSMADAQTFIELSDHKRKEGSGLVSAIEYQEIFAGVIDIKKVDWRAKCCEISYWGSPWIRNKGVTSRALTLISQWVLQEMNFERIEVRIAPENLASQRVAEKAGYSREGIARNAGYINSGRLDLIIYSLIRKDL